jgi:hypothetical protein
MVLRYGKSSIAVSPAVREEMFVPGGFIFFLPNVPAHQRRDQRRSVPPLFRFSFVGCLSEIIHDCTCKALS